MDHLDSKVEIFPCLGQWETLNSPWLWMWIQRRWHSSCWREINEDFNCVRADMESLYQRWVWAVLTLTGELFCVVYNSPEQLSQLPCFPADYVGVCQSHLEPKTKKQIIQCLKSKMWHLSISRWHFSLEKTSILLSQVACCLILSSVFWQAVTKLILHLH